MFKEFTDTAPKQCKLVQKAITRYFDLLKRAKKKGDIYFDEKAAENAIKYVAFFKHYKGSFRGRAFELLPFQQFIVGNIFGWKLTATGKRLYKTAYVEIPRKNGKTALAAAVALHCLLFDGEGAPEVYTAATKEDQAKLCWRDCTKFIKSNQRIHRNVKIRVKHVEVPNSDGILKALGSDSDTLDGLNPHCAIADELHAWKDRGLWDVIEDGMGGRDQPLMFAITTAGYNQNGICFTMRKNVVNILNGIVKDDETFGIIFTVDDEDRKDGRIYDPAVWYKANPALGEAKKFDYMQRQAIQAQNIIEKKNAFLNKQLNIWTSARTAWIDIDKWLKLAIQPDKDATPLTPASWLLGKYCYTALDMSKSIDLTALSLVFPPQDGVEKTTILPFFFVPAEHARRKEKEDNVPYIAWAESGHVFLVDNPYIDRDTVVEFIGEKLAPLYEIKSLPRDRWGTKKMARDLDEKYNIKTTDFGQGFRDMSPACKRFGEMIAGAELQHFGNPCLAWCISNVVAEQDGAENIKFVKNKSFGRIDGAVATAMGIGEMERSEDEEPEPQIYIV